MQSNSKVIDRCLRIKVPIHGVYQLLPVYAFTTMYINYYLLLFICIAEVITFKQV